MSLTSYRAAPPRASAGRRGGGVAADIPVKGHVNGFLLSFSVRALAAMPGDDLLFRCLGSSTIGAVGFHGRVRNGIGWVTDAMATKQWSQCDAREKGFNRCVHLAARSSAPNASQSCH
jgi:hypothetical protein